MLHKVDMLADMRMHPLTGSNVEFLLWEQPQIEVVVDPVIAVNMPGCSLVLLQLELLCVSNSSEHSAMLAKIMPPHVLQCIPLLELSLLALCLSCNTG